MGTSLTFTQLDHFHSNTKNNYNARLKGISRSNILQLLGDLGRSSVELLGNALLFGALQVIVLLAIVAIDDTLDGEIVGAIAQMITPSQWRILGSHVHLQILEEVVVFVRSERHEHAH